MKPKGEAVQSGEHQIQLDTRQVKINRIKLLAIFAVALIPLLLAVVMYFAGWAVPDGKTNKGDLIWPPVAIQSLPYQQDKEALAVWIEEQGNWQLMLTGTGPCENACEEALHLIRQVNVAQGREADRVGRILLLQDGTEISEALAEQYPQLEMRTLNSEQWSSFYGQLRAQLPSTSLHQDSWNIWLVDPLGNVILHYGNEHNGYDIKDDLKRLLKLSKIG